MSAKPRNVHCAYCKALMKVSELVSHVSSCANEHQDIPAWSGPQPSIEQRSADVRNLWPQLKPEPPTTPQRKVAPELTGWPKYVAKWSKLGELGDIEMEEEITARGIKRPSGWARMNPGQRLRWLEENAPMDEE